MKRGELTLIILADFSKAFDTINVLRKVFSNEYLICTTNYLSAGQHFVPVNDKVFDKGSVNFGVPQGSFVGPLILNLYVEDMGTQTNAKCHQYTTYMHYRPENLESTGTARQRDGTEREHWAKGANLLPNSQKTKLLTIQLHF